MSDNTLEMFFGSTSDRDKVMPGIIRATKELGIDAVIRWASADNTLQKVQAYASHYAMQPSPKPWISGAGLSNVLTGMIKSYADPRDLMIGVPIYDSEWGGLSALLSTAEKPPRNPVLTVDLNNTFAAANIAARFRQNTYERVSIYTYDQNANQVPMLALEQELAKIGLPYQRSDRASVLKDELVINLWDITNVLASRSMHVVDFHMRSGSGIQIGVSKKGAGKDQYLIFLDDTDTTGIVSAGGYLNAAYLAAIIMRHEGALTKLEAEKAKKSSDLENAPSERWRNGELVDRMPYRLNK